MGGAVRPDRRQDARAVHAAVRRGDDAVHGTGLGSRRNPLVAGAPSVLAHAVRPHPLFLQELLGWKERQL